MRMTSAYRWTSLRAVGVGIGLSLSTMLLAGCASRTVVEDEPTRLPSAPMASDSPRNPASGQQPQDEPFYGKRQGVGAGPVWMDDPAKRRGPQGQPAPFGRDTITGKPLTDLQPPDGVPGRIGQPARTPIAAAPVRPGTPAAGDGSNVVVGKGETLYAIARRHNVSVAALMQANNLTAESKLLAGQNLVIPTR